MSPRASLAAALLAGVALLVAPGTAGASFGFLPGAEGFATTATKAGGGSATAAGSHPYSFEATVGLNAFGGASDGDLRDLTVSLPPGFLINPTAVSECLDESFETPRVSPFEASASGESCQNTTQVGVIEVNVGGTVRHFGLFNLTPAFGFPVTFGSSPFGVPLIFNGRVREGDVGFDLVLDDLPQSFDLQALKLTIWGTPWEGGNPKTEPSAPPGHNPQRGNCLNEQTGGSWGECLVFESVPAPELQIKSDLTLPTTPCGQAFSYTATVTSWQGDADSAAATTPALSACNKSLATLTVQLMTDVAAARTGLAFNLAVNDGGGILNPGGIGRPAIKTAVASLPEGLTINPSLGAGLGVCDEADFARETATSEPGAGCPNASKIGTVTVEGALGLNEPLQGSVYLARPNANPYGTLIGLYMLARSPRRGLIVKSIGKVEPDPHSGKLVTTFDDLPRLLYTHFTLTLREGQRSTLISPPACGGYRAVIDFASWAEPTVYKHEASTFGIFRGENGGPCPNGAIPPFAPGLLAGSINPIAAAYTPFYLRMSRTDGEQEITSYSATFPPGLLAKIAGVTTCPDAAIEAAKARSGAQELAAPSCPDSSKIGHTIAGYGVGGVLAWAPGSLYLAGPYHGAPLSTVAIDSATIGPFDLGVVVVRSAIRIDPRTAQASIDSAGSDPIPHILAGIPLHLRDIRVFVDRPDFTRNPTSCDKTKVSSLLGGAGTDPFSAADDSTAVSTQRYQLLNCSVLDFKPRLAFRLKGGHRRGALPSLRATYTPRAGDANLKAVAVTLPPALFLEQSHIVDVCSKKQYAQGACPPGSVYGRARATTPLMDEPLTGPVYLRASSGSLPDLVADLHGRGVEIEVPGRIDSVNEAIRATFEGLPDAPVTKFTMTLPGGKRGLLAVAGNLCARPRRANARFIAQSNETEILHPALKATCRRHAKSRSRR